MLDDVLIKYGFSKIGIGIAGRTFSLWKKAELPLISIRLYDNGNWAIWLSNSKEYRGKTATGLDRAIQRL